LPIIGDRLANPGRLNATPWILLKPFAGVSGLHQDVSFVVRLCENSGRVKSGLKICKKRTLEWPALRFQAEKTKVEAYTHDR
jgi:hypothetical protein